METLQDLISKDCVKLPSQIIIFNKSYELNGDYAQVIHDSTPTIRYDMIPNLASLSQFTTKNDFTGVILSFYLMNENFIRSADDHYKVNLNPMGESQIKKTLKRFLQSGKLTTNMPGSHYIMSKDPESEKIFNDIRNSNKLYECILNQNSTEAKNESINTVNGFSLENSKMIPNVLTSYIKSSRKLLM